MFTWTIPLKRDHGASWYATGLIAVASLAIWGFFTEIYALSVAVVIFAGVYLLVENNAPETVEATVNENGIGVDSDFYDYGQIESFALAFDGKIPKFLNLTLRKGGIRFIQIPLNETVETSALRAFLGGYLEESSQGKFTFADKVADRLGL